MTPEEEGKYFKYLQTDVQTNLAVIRVTVENLVEKNAKIEQCVFGDPDANSPGLKGEVATLKTYVKITAALTVALIPLLIWALDRVL